MENGEERGVSQLELHPSWLALTDRQRQAVNEVWDDTVVPALREVAVANRQRDMALIEAQEAAAGARYWREQYDRLRWAVAIDREDAA